MDFFLTTLSPIRTEIELSEEKSQKDMVKMVVVKKGLNRRKTNKKWEKSDGDLTELSC